MTNSFKPEEKREQQQAALKEKYKNQSETKSNELNETRPTTQIKLNRFHVTTVIGKCLANWSNLQTLILDGCYISSLPQLIQALPRLTSLITKNCISTSALFGPIQTENHPLQKLVIDIADVTRKNLLSLTVLQNLQHLKLRRELIDTHTATVLHANLTKLKSLNYNNCFFSEGPREISLGLSSLRQLTALSLQTITTPESINPATELHALSQLRYLNISGNPAFRLSNIPQVLPTSLETVNLENTSVHYPTMGALQSLPKLNTLRIGNTMPNTPLIICLGQLSSLTGLDHLSIQACKFLNDEMLTEMLGNLTELTMLNLKALPQITSNGLQQLTFLSHLQRLHIEDCPQINPFWTTYKGFSKRHPEFISRVQIFHINCQPVTTSDLKRLQAIDPSIKIINEKKEQARHGEKHPSKLPAGNNNPFTCITTHILPSLTAPNAL